MTTLTFLRKFSGRFALGVLVLATPNIVLATQDGAGGDNSSSNTTHPNSHHEQNQGAAGGATVTQHDDGSATGTVHFNLSPQALDQITTALGQLGSGGCSGLVNAASTMSAINPS